MYLENWDTVLPMKKQTIVVSRNEIGMAGPALRAMIGNVNTMLIDGAMCVMPWNTTWGRSRTLRRSRAGRRCCWRFLQSREPPSTGANLVPHICAIGFAILRIG